MRAPLVRSVWLRGLMLALISAVFWAPGGAAAQDASLLEQGSVKLRYGVSLRSGLQSDLGPGLSYDGMTPNDLALSGGFFPSRFVGASASIQREAFALLEEGSQVTGGALLRASVGPTGRLVVGPFRLEVTAGYQFAQLPAFASTALQPELRPAQRHAVLLASRASFALPLGIIAEARGEYPIALTATDAGGAPATSSGFAAGGGVSFPVYSSGSTEGRLALDYQYVTDELRGESSLVSSQKLSRIGAAINVAFGLPDRPAPLPKFGGVRVRVVDAETGAVLSGANAALEQEGEDPRPLTFGADGSALVEALEPGRFVARVNAAGYLPAEGSAQVNAGETASIEVRAKKEPPKVGSLVVKVAELGGTIPVVNARVKIGELEKVTDAAGVATFEALSPGAVGVFISAEGYKPAEEAAQVLASRTAELPVQLAKEKQKVPATISGKVRSVRGQPLKAQLEIPELNQKVEADAAGAFSISVPAGSYRVIISAKGFRQQIKQVAVKEGDQTIFNVDLYPR